MADQREHPAQTSKSTPCEKCEEYRRALERIAVPFSFTDALDPQTDAIIAYVSAKVSVAMEALLDGKENRMGK